MEKNISVFIVSEDIYIRYLYELLFEGFNNISCSTINSIEAAKIELETYIPTFVILDDSLAKEKVFPFVEYLNTNFPCIKILISAEYELIYQIKSENKIIYRIIEKPFRIEDIKVVIDNLTKIARCTKEVKCFTQDCSRLVLEVG